MTTVSIATPPPAMPVLSTNWKDSAHYPDTRAICGSALVNLTFSKVGDVGIVRVDASRIDAAVAIQFKDLFSQIVIQMGIDRR
jgi:hypothetical protein